jgi:hypothetical protein
MKSPVPNREGTDAASATLSSLKAAAKPEDAGAPTYRLLTGKALFFA